MLSVRPWTIGRYQSYAFAKVWEGTARLPTQKQMREDYEIGKYHFRGLYGTLPAEGTTTLYFLYLKEVHALHTPALFRQYVAWLNNESLENGGRFVEPWPVE